METNYTKQTAKKGRKNLIIAASVIGTLIVLILAFLALKSTIFYSIALQNVKKNEFKAAESYLDGISNDKSKVLEDYVALRIDVNSQYASLIADFDIEMVRNWQNKAAILSGEIELLPEEIKPSAQILCQKLNDICTFYDEYQALYPDIMSLMDVFTEINKFYTKGEDGKNKPITITEERIKIANWNALFSKVEGYFTRISTSDIYLVSYMLKEAQGEIAEIDNVMNQLVAKGFKETDTVIIKGENNRTFASVTSSDGTTVNLAQKDMYAQQMTKGVYRKLAQSLSEFYVGI